MIGEKVNWCSGKRGGRMQIASFCRFFLYIELDPHISSPSWLDVVAVGGLATWDQKPQFLQGPWLRGPYSVPHSFQDHESMVPAISRNLNFLWPFRFPFRIINLLYGPFPLLSGTSGTMSPWSLRFQGSLLCGPFPFTFRD
jgi:hypothetical protein